MSVALGLSKRILCVTVEFWKYAFWSMLVPGMIAPISNILYSFHFWSCSVTSLQYVINVVKLLYRMQSTRNSSIVSVVQYFSLLSLLPYIVLNHFWQQNSPPNTFKTAQLSLEEQKMIDCISANSFKQIRWPLTQLFRCCWNICACFSINMRETGGSYCWSYIITCQWTLSRCMGSYIILFKRFSINQNNWL